MISYDFGMHLGRCSSASLRAAERVRAASAGDSGSRNGCEATAGLSIAPTCAVMFVTSVAVIAKSRISLFTGNLEIPIVPFVL